MERLVGGDAPYIDDHCAPTVIDHYTEAELEAFPLAMLYKRSCEKRDVAPEPTVLKQLPATIHDHWQVISLDFRRCYLGVAGTAAVLSVVEACRRLTNLTLVRAGMDAATGKALVHVLSTHPSIREVDISDNELGTAVGQMLVRLVAEHRRIYRLEVDKCLVIQPLLRKIKAQLERNVAMMHDFSVMPVPLYVSPEDARRAKIAAEEAEARRQRAAAEAERIAASLPVWAPAALYEFALAIHKHRKHVADFVSTFVTSGPTDRYTSATNFVRAMNIVDVPSLSRSTALAAEFAGFFHAYDAAADAIDFVTIVRALRPHVEVVVDDHRRAAAPPSCVNLADRLYDARDTLRRSFELIDVDTTGFVELREVVVGVCALAPAREEGDVAAFVRSVMGDREGTATLVPYAAFLRRLQYPKETEARGARSDFANLMRKDVAALVPTDLA